MLCVILGREFTIISRRLNVIISDKTNQDIDGDLKSKKLEELRQHYENVYDVVTQADGVIKYTALIGFFFGILVFCFGLYSICRDNLDFEENGSILLMLTSVLQILAYTISGCFLNDKAHSMRDILLKYAVTDMGGNAYKTIHLFLARASGNPIGITVLETFTIDRTSTLTVSGTILSYAVLVLQLGSTSPGINSPCSNVTGV
ncbi:uncharacterized protein [Haliotis cracherodii]|uniref:uncharacterized protein n=1 Tax=Haliotis cracherodii TaxID=6455 RepID=UPI0039EA66DB